MSRFFISRPIFASVISIIIMIAGLMASLTLPVAQYPEITPPTVIISATFPGANAETGAQLFVDTHDSGFRKRFAEAAQRREQALREALSAVVLPGRGMGPALSHGVTAGWG